LHCPCGVTLLPEHHAESAELIQSGGVLRGDDVMMMLLQWLLLLLQWLLWLQQWLLLFLLPTAFPVCFAGFSWCVLQRRLLLLVEGFQLRVVRPELDPRHRVLPGIIHLRDLRLHVERGGALPWLHPLLDEAAVVAYLRLGLKLLDEMLGLDYLLLVR